MTIRRFSSRTQRLNQSFLAEQLQGARSYRRIAGYFTSRAAFTKPSYRSV
jgi:hypothetical protein